MFFNWNKVETADVTCAICGWFGTYRAVFSPNYMMLRDIPNISTADVQQHIEKIVRPYKDAVVVNTLFTKLVFMQNY